jgi:hypothetical protein
MNKNLINIGAAHRPIMNIFLAKNKGIRLDTNRLVFYKGFEKR